MPILRRRDDEEGSDFVGVRAGSVIDHVKWISAVVSAGIIATLGFFAVSDRNNIERRLTAVETLAIATAQVQAANVAKTDARWEEIQRTLLRIESEVTTIKALKTFTVASQGSLQPSKQDGH